VKAVLVFRTRSFAGLATLLLIVGVITAFPLVFLVQSSFDEQPLPGAGGQGFTLRKFGELFSGKFVKPAINTIVYSVSKTILIVSAGAILSWITVRTNAPLKKLIDGLIVLPLLLPATLYYVGWALLMSPRGWVNGFLQDWMGLSEPIFSVFSLEGVILAGSAHTLPFAYLLLRPAMIIANPEYEDAARIAGSNLIQTFARVTVPLLLPAILIAAIISLVRGIETFTPFIFLGTPVGVNSLSTQILVSVQRTVPPDYGFASALAVFLVAVTSFLVYFYRRATSMTAKYTTITGKAVSPRLVDLRRFRYALSLVVVAILMLLYIPPIIVTVVNSLLPFGMPLTLDIFRRMSLNAYVDLLGDELFRQALGNTSILLVASSTIAMTIAILTAYVSIRTKLPGRSILYILALLPLTIPGVSLGLAVLWTYVRTPIYGTVLILVLAATAKMLPNAVAISSQVMHQVGHELEESSRILGASWAFTFRRIMIPLVMASLLPGLSYLMVATIGDLDYVLLLRSAENEVLATLVWSNWIAGYLPTTAALGVLSLGFGLGVFFIPRFLEERLWLKAAIGRRT